MPYTRDDTSDLETIRLWPHRSLPPQGFAWVIGMMFALALLPLIAVLGTPVLWGLLPFAMGALWMLWIALRRSYKDGDLEEVLTLSPDLVELTRTNPRGPAQHWKANPYWVRVAMHPKDGPVENYLTLHGGDRDVEIGSFLSPDERVALYDDLTRAFDGARNSAV